uniref:Ig-like domain-containing protein n=1 Tax=Periophthalmus magnuspinnatus TaxID=409849 RepID=A0A3B4AI38_9GOBI
SSSVWITTLSQNGLHKKGGFLAAFFGDNVTLRCTSSEVGAKLNWFRQKWGMKPVLISSYFKYDQNREFYKEFRSNNHFKMDYGDDKNDLSIMNVSSSDSAVYHCVRSFLHQSDFQESVTVIVKSLHPTAEVHQSPHEEIEPGHSVILHCSVQTDGCVGQHRVHWFKQSEESAAGLLYSHGGSSDQCESNTDGPNNPCVYNLPIHNVSSQQTGTYYCAVAACGQVLFGIGTRVTLKDGVHTVMIHMLSGALALSSVLLILLAFVLCTTKNEYSRSKSGISNLSPPPFK